MTRRRPSLPRWVADLVLLLIVAAAALAVRTWLIGLYVVPSRSMLPRLMPGDYVLVAKFPFRFRHDLPARGDVVVLRAPPTGETTYVKRVIGLPGDTVALRHGRLVLNGATLPRWRIADLLLPEAPNRCCQGLAERQPDGHQACRYARHREMLPGGATVDSIDTGPTAADERAPTRVPPGRLFLLGDNRDDSGDSRFAAGRGGIGLVPAGNVVGRVELILFSADGSARLAQPRTWAQAVRWERIGTRF